MKLEKVENLKGNEILARPIITDNDMVLMYEGICLKKEYIDRLKLLNIETVYINDEQKMAAKEIIKNELLTICKEKVREVLEGNIYKSNHSLDEIYKTTNKILENIIQQDEVIDKVYDIKDRSPDIYEHSVNVCIFSIIMGLKYKINKNDIISIGVGSLLHDMGLRYITSSYENCELNNLPVHEMLEYKKHSIYGYSSIEKENWLSDISKNIILYHHERLNGQGFPLKLKDIALEIMIVSVCDTFDEMVCGIGYKKLKVHEAIEYLKFSRKLLFDENVVDIFLSFVAVYPTGSIVITNEGEKALVVSQNEHFTDRPVLKIIEDKNKNIVKEEKIVDLIKIHHIFIEDVLD